MSSVTITLVPSDLLSAWRLQRRRNAFVRAAWLMPLFLAGLYLLVFWRDLLEYGWRMIVWEPALPLMVVFLTVLNILVDKVTLPNRAKRILGQQKALGGEIVFAWDAAGMQVTGATGHTRLAWGHFVRWLEDDASLVMFQSDNVLNPLPKRCLTDDQAAEIRGYLTAAIGKAGKKRS